MGLVQPLGLRRELRQLENIEKNGHCLICKKLVYQLRWSSHYSRESQKGEHCEKSKFRLNLKKRRDELCFGL